MTFAGQPPTTAYAGTSFVTTEPAAIIAPSPIFAPHYKNISSDPNIISNFNTSTESI